MKILVVGDSFMAPDPKFPGTHWTEIIGSCEVINLSQVGASIPLIFHNLFLGFDQHPDKVVVGMTDPYRITFDRPPGRRELPVEWDYVTSAQESTISDDQQHLKLQFQALSSERMNVYTGFFLLLGILRELEYREIPFVYTLGLMESSLYFLDESPIKDTIESFQDRMLMTNLAKYPDIKLNVPSHHVDSMEWQMKFANEVRRKLLDI